jgi:hypothetical protein
MLERDLPETHMYQQAVVRLCQGAADKEAGSYASNIRPKNIEEVRLFRGVLGNQTVFLISVLDPYIPFPGLAGSPPHSTFSLIGPLLLLQTLREIPEHLINLFDKSKGELNEQEQTQLSELLCEFEDVFAKSEFDLGKFNQFGIPYIPG